MTKLSEVADISHSIDAMLSREISIARLDYDSSAAYNVARSTYSPFTVTENQAIMNAQPLRSLLSNKLIFDRCVGFRYFTCSKIKILLKWNINPFLQGKIGLYYTVDGQNMAKMILPEITAYPGVIGDINTESSCELEIPWPYPCKAVDLSKTTINEILSSLRVFVVNILPISAADVYNLHFQMYAQLENPKLFGPTIFGSSVTDPSDDLVNLFGDIPLTSNKFPAVERAYAQVNPSANESSNSTASTTLGGVGASVLNMIPGIGSAFSLASSATNVLGSVASAFGFNKFYNDKVIQRVTVHPAYGIGNCDGDDSSIALAMTRQPMVDPSKFSVFTSTDEMTISHIGEREAAVGYVTWDETALAGQNLPFGGSPTESGFEKLIGYTNCDRVTLTPRIATSLTTSAYDVGATPGEFVASQFLKCHFDEIVYTIDFAKTAFHNGVLEAGFRAHVNGVGGVIPNGDSQTYNNTLIVDILNRKKIEIRIPFMYHKYWINPSEGIGTIYLRVISPLISNPNVDNKIIGLVSKKIIGLKCDIIAPMFRNMNPFKLTLNTNFSSIVDEDDGLVPPTDTVEEPERAVAQINLAVNNDVAVLQVGTTVSLTEDVISATTGEVCLSVRKMLKCFRRLYTQTTDTSIPLPVQTQVNHLLDHRYFLANDYFATMFARMFFFHTGSIRFKYFGASASKPVSSNLGFRKVFRLGQSGSYTGPWYPESHYTYHDPEHQRIVETTLPFYGSVPVRYNTPNILTLGDVPIADIEGDTPLLYHVTIDGRVPFTDPIFAAIGDDFSFFGLRGVPSFTCNLTEDTSRSGFQYPEKKTTMPTIVA